jgi:hypothetical protein
MEAHRQKDRSKEADNRLLLTNPPSNPILSHRKDRPDHAVWGKKKNHCLF